VVIEYVAAPLEVEDDDETGNFKEFNEIFAAFNAKEGVKTGEQKTEGAEPGAAAAEGAAKEEKVEDEGGDDEAEESGSDEEKDEVGPEDKIKS